MIKFVFSIGLIIGGLLWGSLLNKMVVHKVIKQSVPVDQYLKFAQRVALLGINPFITLGAF